MCARLCLPGVFFISSGPWINIPATSHHHPVPKRPPSAKANSLPWLPWGGSLALVPWLQVQQRLRWRLSEDFLASFASLVGSSSSSLPKLIPHPTPHVPSWNDLKSLVHRSNYSCNYYNPLQYSSFSPCLDHTGPTLFLQHIETNKKMNFPIISPAHVICSRPWCLRGPK